MFEKELDNFIKNALLEDIGDGDHTSLGCISKDTISKAHLLVKDNGIIAGIELGCQWQCTKTIKNQDPLTRVQEKFILEM